MSKVWLQERDSLNSEGAAPLLNPVLVFRKARACGRKAVQPHYIKILTLLPVLRKPWWRDRAEGWRTEPSAPGSPAHTDPKCGNAM